MFYNGFKIAVRNLRRHAAYSVINISGLTIGLTCCIMIALYIKDELAFDRYNTNIDRMYRVVHAFTNGTAPVPEDFQVWGSSPVGAYLPMDFVHVDKVAQFSSVGSYLFQHGDIRIQEEAVFFADSTVFDIFSWKMLEGEPGKALVAPYSVVLTASAARRYFGDESALGQSIVINNGRTFHITGIVQDVPQNSQIRFDALISSTTWRQESPGDFESWGYVDFYTYFTVKDGFDPAAFSAQIPTFLKRRNPEGENYYTFKIERAGDAYLNSTALRQPGPTGSLSSLYTLGTIAVFILMLACINFMNLSTARSLDRAKEVGVRKLVGAKREWLMRQFLAESFVMSLIAMSLAFVISCTALPAFQLISDKSFAVKDLVQSDMIIGMIAGTLLVGLLAGIYPAFVLSRFSPAIVLKGIFRNSSEGAMLRKALVVFQFGISVVLIIGALVVFNQLEYMQGRDKGYTKDQMVIVDFGGDGKARRELNVIKEAISKIPGVISVSAQRTVPGGFFPRAYTQIAGPDGAMVHRNVDLYEVDYDFISNFDMTLVAGRDYSRSIASDSTKAMIINETASKALGYSDPQQVIGKQFSQWGKEGMIIGVVKDFNYKSLHTSVEGLTLRLTPEDTPNSIAVRVDHNKLGESIPALEATWKTYVPQRPFLFNFLDDEFNKQYHAEQNFGSLVLLFTGLAIFVASIGLFGLTTYIAEQRTREIGIRKVLGASMTSLVKLLSSDFLKLVLLSVVVAIPAAFYVMDNWLKRFAYRISPDVPTYVLPAVTVVMVALIVISIQAIRASTANPVKSLRND